MVLTVLFEGMIKNQYKIERKEQKTSVLNDGNNFIFSRFFRLVGLIKHFNFNKLLNGFNIFVKIELLLSFEYEFGKLIGS